MYNESIVILDRLDSIEIDLKKYVKMSKKVVMITD